MWSGSTADSASVLHSGAPASCQCMAPDKPAGKIPAQPALPRLLSPVINCAAGNLESPEFLASCKRPAKELRLNERLRREAWRAGVEVQRQFDAGCRNIGRRTPKFCRARNIVPVVVLGRARRVIESDATIQWRSRERAALDNFAFEVHLRFQCRKMSENGLLLNQRGDLTAVSVH